MAPAVVFKVLNGMTESVAIVQDLTEARFLQILSDNACLDSNRALDQFWQVTVNIEAGLRVCLVKIENLRVRDKSSLDDLCRARNQFSLRQGAQDIQVTEHRGRLVEGADQVLSGCSVDTGLTADSCVDHAEQRCRDLDNLHSTHPRGGDESTEICGCTAANRDYRVTPAQTAFTKSVPNCFSNCERLTLLRIRNLDAEGIDSLVRQCLDDAEAQLLNAPLVNHRNLGGKGSGLRNLLGESMPHGHRVRGWAFNTDCAG